MCVDVHLCIYLCVCISVRHRQHALLTSSLMFNFLSSLWYIQWLLQRGTAVCGVKKTPGCAVAGSESAVMAVRIGSGCVLGSL